jgi:hypothetical protein
MLFFDRIALQLAPGVRATSMMHRNMMLRAF